MRIILRLLHLRGEGVRWIFLITPISRYEAYMDPSAFDGIDSDLWCRVLLRWRFSMQPYIDILGNISWI